MVTKISLEMVRHKIKVVAPYTEEFVKQSHILHGRWKQDAWWFDDSALDLVRQMLLRMWNTTGEKPYDECCLLIKNYSKCVRLDSVYLFNRMIAKAFGRRSGIQPGMNIRFISGTIKPGGTEYEWETQVLDATFEIDNFPLPAIDLPDVKMAIAEGWCDVNPVSKPRSKEEVEAEIQGCQLRLTGLRMELNYI